MTAHRALMLDLDGTLADSLGAMRGVYDRFLDVFGVAGNDAEFARLNGPPLPVVDTHQHLWDLEKFKPPWLSGAPEVLKRSYVTKDYLAAIGDR